MFLSNWLTLKIVSAALGLLEYPSAKDAILTFDGIDSLYFSGGSKEHIENIRLVIGTDEKFNTNVNLSNIFIQQTGTYTAYINICGFTFKTNSVTVSSITNRNFELATGSHSTFCLTEDKTVYACGSNSNNNLGLPYSIGSVNSLFVHKFLTSKKIKSISTRLLASHSLACDDDGNLYSWGYNGSGQLGIGNTTTVTQGDPYEVKGLDVSQVCVANDKSFIINSSGDVYSCGYNTFGTLGLGDTTDRSTFTKITTFNKAITQIIAGHYHALALDIDGNVWGWGMSQYFSGDDMRGLGGTGINGVFNNYAYSHTPAKIQNFTNISKIYAGYFHSAALNNTGNVFIWGGGAGGINGMGSQNYPLNTPTENMYFSSNNIVITDLSLGTYHSLALSSTGNVYAWGSNASGQCGQTNTTSPLVTPEQVGIKDMIYVSTGSDTSSSINSNGYMFVWGSNTSGQGGLGTYDTRVGAQLNEFNIKNLTKCYSDGYKLTIHNKPNSSNTVLIHNSTNTINIKNSENYYTKETGTYEYYIIDELHKNAYTGSITVSSLNEIEPMVSGTSYTSYFLNKYGEVYGWGKNNYGLLGSKKYKLFEPFPVKLPFIEPIKYLLSDDEHGIALSVSNTVYTWGNNFEGPLMTTFNYNTYNPNYIQPLDFTLFDGEISNVFIGQDVSAVLTSTNKMYTAGWDGYTPSYGNMKGGGDGPVPTLITPPSGCTWVYYTGGHRVGSFIDSLGRIHMTGHNYNNAVFSGSGATFTLTPYLITQPSVTFVKVSIHNNAALALTDTGNVYAWGYGYKVPFAPLDTSVTGSPTQFFANNCPAKDISTHNEVSRVLFTNGELLTVMNYNWSLSGNPGLSYTHRTGIPQQVYLNKKIKKMSSRSSYNANYSVLDEDGYVYSFGINIDTSNVGLLGTGDFDNASSQNVGPQNSVINLSNSGYLHSNAFNLKYDGKNKYELNGFSDFTFDNISCQHLTSIFVKDPKEYKISGKINDTYKYEKYELNINLNGINGLAINGDGSVSVVGRSGSNEVYVYEDTYDNQLTTEKITESISNFGESVALNGDGTVLAVGATPAQQVRVYQKTNGSWNSVNDYYGNAGDSFGSDVALSKDGNTLIIGAYLGVTNYGRVEIHDRSAGTFVNIPNPEQTTTYASFGRTVDINDDGTIAFIPAYNSNKLFIYYKGNGDWTTNIIVTVSNTNNLGSSISCNGIGDMFIVGDEYNDTGATDIGSAYIFKYEDGSWVNKKSLYGEIANARFGSRVSMSNDGNVVMVGSPNINTNTGRVYIYKKFNEDWHLMYKSTGTSPNIYHGNGVDLNNDGSTGLIVDTHSNSNLYLVRNMYDYTTTSNALVSVNTSNQLSNVNQIFLRPSILSASDNFGSAVSTYGNTFVISTINTVAKMYIYDMEVLQQTITPSSFVATQGETKLFYNHAIYDTHIVTVNGSGGGGNFYVYEYVSGSWTLGQSISSGAGYLSQCHVYDDLIVVSDPSHNTNTGRILVYRKTSGTWTQETTLTRSGGSSGDYFGDGGVHIYGNTIAASSPQVSGGQGRVTIFTYSGGTWSQEDELSSPLPVSNQNYGYDISLYQDTLVVGSLNGGSNYTGEVFLYRRSGTTWQEFQKLLPNYLESTTYYGRAVSIYGKYIAVGAHGENTNTGAVYIFEEVASNIWKQSDKITASDASTNDDFGYKLDIHNHLITSSIKNDVSAKTDSGSAYIFESKYLGPTITKNKLNKLIDNTINVASSNLTYNSNSYIGTSNIYYINGLGDYELISSNNDTLSFTNVNVTSINTPSGSYTYKLVAKWKVGEYTSSGVNIYMSEMELYNKYKEKINITNLTYHNNPTVLGTDPLTDGYYTTAPFFTQGNYTSYYVNWYTAASTIDYLYEYDLISFTTSEEIDYAYFYFSTTLPPNFKILLGNQDYMEIDSVTYTYQSDPGNTSYPASNAYIQFEKYPKFNYDGLDKITINNISGITSSNLVKGVNEYFMGTASNVYIDSTGTYELVSRTSNSLLLLSNTISSLGNFTSPSVRFDGEDAILPGGLSNFNVKVYDEYVTDGSSFKAFSSKIVNNTVVNLTNEFTMTFWFRHLVNASGSYEILVNDPGYPTISGSFRIYASEMYIYGANLSTYLRFILPFDANKWFLFVWKKRHVGSNYINDIYIIPKTENYIENIQDYKISSTGTGSFSSWNTNIQATYFTVRETVGSYNGYNGYYDDFRVYNSILTTDELVKYFNYTLNPKPVVEHVGYSIKSENIVKFGNYDVNSGNTVTVNNTGTYDVVTRDAGDFSLNTKNVSSFNVTGEKSIQYGVILSNNELYSYGMLNYYGGLALGYSGGSLKYYDRKKINIPGKVVKLFKHNNYTEAKGCKTEDNHIWLWGQGNYWQVDPLGTFNNDALEPRDMTFAFGDPQNTANNITDIVFGQTTAYALTESGNVWMWGTQVATSFSFGQNNSNQVIHYTPVQQSYGFGAGTIAKIGAGNQYAVVLTNSGDVWAWGLGQVPVPSQFWSYTFGAPIVNLAAYTDTFYYWFSNGDVFCFGGNNRGTYGNGNNQLNIINGQPNPYLNTYFSSNSLTINNIYATYNVAYADVSDSQGSNIWYTWGTSADLKVNGKDTLHQFYPTIWTDKPDGDIIDISLYNYIGEFLTSNLDIYVESTYDFYDLYKHLYKPGFLFNLHKNLDISKEFNYFNFNSNVNSNAIINDKYFVSNVNLNSNVITNITGEYIVNVQSSNSLTFSNTNFTSITYKDDFMSGDRLPDYIITANDTVAGDYFGSDIATHGDTIAIRSGGSYGTNSIYVFVKNGNEWTQQQKITPSQTITNIGLDALDIYNDRLAFGERYYNASSGSVYIWKRTGTTWTQEQQITPSTPTSAAEFGNSIRFYLDEKIIIGEWKNGTGAAYIFTRSGTTWTQQQKITPGNPIGPATFFGSSVAINNDRCIVGAYNDNNENGAVYVYFYNGTTWVEQKKLTPLIYPSRFGYSLDMTYDRFIVGCYTYNNNGGGYYIFSISDKGGAISTNGPSSDAYFKIMYSYLEVITPGLYIGQRVKINDNYNFASENGHTVFGNASAGKLRVLPDIVRTTHQHLGSPSPHAYEYFSYGIGASNDRLVVGGRGTTGMGKVYVYEKMYQQPHINQYYNKLETIFNKTTTISNVMHSNITTTSNIHNYFIDTTGTYDTFFESTNGAGIFRNNVTSIPSSPITTTPVVRFSFDEDEILPYNSSTGQYSNTHITSNGYSNGTIGTHGITLHSITNDYMTMSFWINALSGTEILTSSIFQLSAFQDNIGIKLSYNTSDVIDCIATTSSLNFNPLIPVTYNKWYHICLVYPKTQGFRPKLYLNGRIMGIGNPTTSSLSDSTNIFLGALSSGFIGFIDNFELYNGELIQEHIQYLYKSQLDKSTLKYDGLSVLSFKEKLTSSNVKIYNNSTIVACDTNTFLSPNPGTYYASLINGTTYTDKTNSVVVDTVGLKKYPPSGVISSLTTTSSAGGTSSWYVNNKEYGTGQYQVKCDFDTSPNMTAFNLFNSNIHSSTFTLDSLTVNGSFSTDATMSAANTPTIELTLPSQVNIKKYRLWPSDSTLSHPASPGSSVSFTLYGNYYTDNIRRPKSWTLYGSADGGSSFTQIHSVTNNPPNVYGYVHTITSPGNYNVYKLYVTSTNGDDWICTIGEFELWG